MFSQNDSINFRLPIDYSVSLSANFGELRPNHFHTGLDFRTKGHVGEKMYAIEDGYISRIRISPIGYGNTLYITHPNGYVSVYAHLLKFNKTIDTYIKQYQYKEKLNSLDMYPSPTDLIIRKGDIIAYGGNSGSSQGPHLHFEIREEATELAINPLQFYPKIVDYAKPLIFNIAIYPLDDTSLVDGGNKKRFYNAVAIGNGKYRIKGQPSIYGNIGFAIQGRDRMTNSNNKFGYYSVKLFINDTLHYYHSLDEVNFEKSRYINSLADYGHYKLRKTWVQKAFIDCNNQLDIYKHVVGNGSYTALSHEVTNIKFEVADYAGNISSLEFSTQTKRPYRKRQLTENYTVLFRCDTTIDWSNSNANIHIPNDALYTDLKFDFSVDSMHNTANTFSNIYSFHNRFTPLQTNITISFPTDSIEKKYTNKVVLCNLVNNRLYATNGAFYNNRIIGTVNELGDYVAALDTIAPSIRGYGLYNNINLKYTSKIKFRIDDNLSGIGNYNAYIDGKWVILYFDKKYSLLSHTFDHNTYTANTKHTFLLIVEDKVGNKKEYSFDFYK